MVDVDDTMAKDYGGYSLEYMYLYNKSGKLLSEGDLEMLNCCNCKKLLRDPCQLIGCGCRFCRSCLDNDILKQDPRVCPEDDEPINDGDVRTDKGCLREIQRLTVVCKGKDNGCTWSGGIEETESHVNNCTYITVPCPNGCGQSFSRSNLNSHMEECPKKPNTQQMIALLLQKVNHWETIGIKLQSENAKLQQDFVNLRKEMSKLKQDEIPKLETQVSQLNEELSRLKSLKEGGGGGVMSDSGYRPPIVSVDDHGSNRKDGGGDQGYGSGAFGTRNPYISSSSSGSSASGGFGGSSYPSSSGSSSYPSTISSGYASSSPYSSPPNSVPSPVEEELRVAINKIQVDINSLKPAVNEFSRMQSQLVGYMETVQTVQESVTRHAVAMEEIKLRQDILDVKTTHGIFIWKIPEIERRYNDAHQRRTLSLYSPPFHTSPHGYRMCIRAYLNGDGSGKSTHISVFFVLMKSEHDNLLSWPFKSPVTFQLLNLDNPSNSITETFMPDVQSPSFQQPKSEMNIASGFPRFAKQACLKDPSFTRGDAIFIRCKVDLSNIEPKE